MKKIIIAIFSLLLISCKHVDLNYYVATVESINGTEVTVKAEGKLYTFDFYGSDLEVGDSITIGVPNNHEIFTYF